MVGSIPPTLGKLTRLQKLYLANNKLTGTIPQQLARLTDLRELNAFNNELTGSIPPFLGDFSKLKYLSLHSNEITGIVPDSVVALCSAPETRSCMLLEQYEQTAPDVARELEELTPDTPRKKSSSTAKAVNACMAKCRAEGRRECTHCIDLFYLF